MFCFLSISTYHLERDFVILRAVLINSFQVPLLNMTTPCDSVTWNYIVLLTLLTLDGSLAGGRLKPLTMGWMGKCRNNELF